MDAQFPILEFDPAREALLEPSKLVKPKDVPEHCVCCFFQDVIDKLVGSGGAREIACQRSEMGKHPVYRIEVGGRPVALAHPGIGGPLAAGMLEEIIALGCRKFVMCGGAGVLDREIAVGHLIVVSAAVRDEGTSYHYLAPSREVQADGRAVAAIEAELAEQGCRAVVGKTWTTDAFYRETPGKIRRRREEGCITVEMEAASVMAVARFREVPLGVILYGGDDCSGTTWDSRQWQSRSEVRERLVELAAKACLRL
jgi:uridine phosphorylase